MYKIINTKLFYTYIWSRFWGVTCPVVRLLFVGVSSVDIESFFGLNADDFRRDALFTGVPPLSTGSISSNSLVFSGSGDGDS